MGDLWTGFRWRLENDDATATTAYSDSEPVSGRVATLDGIRRFVGSEEGLSLMQGPMARVGAGSATEHTFAELIDPDALPDRFAGWWLRDADGNAPPRA